MGYHEWWISSTRRWTLSIGEDEIGSALHLNQTDNHNHKSVAQIACNFALTIAKRDERSWWIG